MRKISVYVRTAGIFQIDFHTSKTRIVFTNFVRAYYEPSRSSGRAYDNDTRLTTASKSKHSFKPNRFVPYVFPRRPAHALIRLRAQRDFRETVSPNSKTTSVALGEGGDNDHGRPRGPTTRSRRRRDPEARVASDAVVSLKM